MWPPAEAPVTVRLSTAADASAGMPPLPATFSRTVPCAATFASGAPVPLRVSSSRVGPYAWYDEPAVTTNRELAVALPCTSVAFTVTEYEPSAAYRCDVVMVSEPDAVAVEGLLPSPQSIVSDTVVGSLVSWVWRSMP